LAVSLEGQVKSMKPYQKPVLFGVELVAEEAVLGSCKTTILAVGPVGGGDCQIGNGTQCMSIGS
jgi:hypothetical protein